MLNMVYTGEESLSSVVEKFEVPEKYAYLFENYDADVYRGVVSSIASQMSSSESIELAGKLVIADIVRAAGSLSTYLITFRHRLSDRVRTFMEKHLDELNQLLIFTEGCNYIDHDFFSASTMAKTYFMRPDFGEAPAESPTQMYLRVAVHMYCDEGIERVEKAYLEMACRLYTHASPTLFNAGTKKSQGSSCFLMTLGDSLDSILGTGVRDAGMIAQHKGGLGIGLGKIRHSAISGAGMSSGVMPVTRLLDKLVTYVDQGGARAGAGTAYLPIWHIDVWDFINSTNNFSQSHSQRLSHLNTALWVHDLFFRRLSEPNGKWTVFCPAKAKLNGLYGMEFEEAYEAYELLAAEREEDYKNKVNAHNEARNLQMRFPTDEEIGKAAAQALSAKRTAKQARIDHRVYSAQDLLNHIVDLEAKSGFPYIMNGDAVNAKCNQANIGKVNSSNLCTEITEVSDDNSVASCNLASISLKAFARKALPAEVRATLSAGHASAEEIVRAIKDHECFDFEKMAFCVQSLVENLDHVITHNYYPVPEKTQTTNFTTRPLGIGVSGFDDAVKILDLEFESEYTEALNKGIFACLYFNALISSARLAGHKGEYERFRDGSFVNSRSSTQIEEYGVEPPVSSKLTHDGKVIEETYSGSPASNGLLQFDLWNRDASVKSALGRLDDKVYNRKDDTPLSPSVWGQPDTFVGKSYGSDLKVTDWATLKEAVKKYGLRNSMLLTIMPTASTAQILRNAESTEVHASNIYTRTVMSGNYTVANQHLVKDLEKIGLWNSNSLEFLVAFGGSMKFFKQFVLDHHTDYYADVTLTQEVLDRIDYIVSKYKTMFEISQKTILKYSRQRAIYIDQSQSLNIYLEDPSLTQLKAVHKMGYKLGLKTGLYYLRQKTGGNNNATFSIQPRMLSYKRQLLSGGGNDKAVVAEKEAPAPPMACTFDMKERGECMSCQ